MFLLPHIIKIQIQIFLLETETFDSISGLYSMKGDYDTLRVVDGKGKYSIRTSAEGQKRMERYNQFS